ncbi:unnamed protein product [Macrosiphum euphorbiae]|uniref:Uncharacterized protein n=1 Tax=Macrosiphum euphorbiae TaxID=13131 RepID=A0AAV0WX53_9HEMI|nr:unnamed protein product [Macrosiphum euphorbiae]
MKVALTVLALVTTLELVLGVPVYGPPQPLPIPHKYRSPNGAPIPAKYPPHPSGHSGKNEFYTKFNPHSLPPGLRGPAPQPPPPFAKYPHLPPPGKHQQQYQQQNPHQHQQQQQQQHHHHQQQQQQQQHLQQPHHSPNSVRPVGPQFQSKPHLLQNGAPHHSSQQGQVNSGPEQRVQLVPARPTPKITNVWTGPQLSGSPDFPPRFPDATNSLASVTKAPFLEKPSGSYIINSDDERGPIKTIPAPNLNPADKPANFEEQLYRAQHQQSYVQPLDNSITDEKPSYQVTEVPSGYKQFNSQPSYFGQDLGITSSVKVPPSTDSNSIPTVPLDIALQQHLENQHHQQLSAEHIGSTDTLTPQELYSLLNSNQAVVPQATYMVPQTVMYAVPQPQSLDPQVGQQIQYQAQPVQLQYAQQPTATGVQLQYAQPATADLQYLQPQTVQYQPQAVQYQPQAIQYQAQSDHLQQPYQQQSAEQYGAQTAAAEISAQKQQQQQELILQQQEEQQQQQEQLQQQQREQLKQQQQGEQQQQQQLQQQQQQQLQQEQQQQLQQQQQLDNDVQYQQEQDDYEPRNGDKGSAEQPPVAVPAEDDEPDQRKLQSIRDQYYSAVPNEQTASVLAQIAQSAANNDEPSRVADASKPAEKSPAEQSVQMHTSVQIQQSVPLYEGTYASSRRTNQEYADEGGETDELMEGSESVAVSESSSSSVNGHAPNQFPYSAAKINGFAAN